MKTFAVTLLLLTCPAAFAQSREGVVYGFVKDSTGAVVPRASLTLTEASTGVARSAASGESGSYTFNALATGKYTITAKAPGFALSTINNLVLELEERREVNFTLTTESQAAVTTVSASALELERDSSTLGQTIHEQQVAQLPLNGRNFVQLATLAPGVTTGNGAFFSNRGASEVAIRGTVSLSAQGMRENSNDWLLDGIDNNELSSGAISIQPSIDSIQEFKVLTYNYSAQYGSRGGTTIIVNTKSGTNDLHGSAFEFFRNDHLDARNFFDGATKGKYNQNQTGGGVGGPIKKNKTFFWGDYQRTWIRQGLTILSTVPSINTRNGIFTDSFPGSPAKLIYDPATTQKVNGVNVRTAFPNNIIPPSRLDPVAVKLLNVFPAPTFTDRLGGNYLSNPERTFDQNYFNTRFDHNFSEKDLLFGRFSFDNSNQFSPSGLPTYGGGTSGNQSTVTYGTKARNLAISETHIFSAKKINELTLGYNRDFNTIVSYGEGKNASDLFGIPGSNVNGYISSGLANIRLTGGYNRIGDRLYSPYQGGTNVFHVVDTFSWILGKHNVKIGYVQRFMQLNSIGVTYPAGNFTFDNLFTAAFTSAGALNSATGDPVASLLLGLPTSGSRSVQYAGSVIGRRWKEFREFVEDDFRVLPNLTLNIGLAYVCVTPQSEVANRQANFDPATGQFLIPGKNADIYAGVHPDRTDFEPRFGFAWSPVGAKTVFRGGYGIFHDVSQNGGTQGLYLNPPYTSELGFTTDNITPFTTLDKGFVPQPQPVDPTTYTGNITTFQRDFKNGLVQQWNINIERELPGAIVLTTAYAGTHATRLQGQTYNLDTASIGPGTNPAARRPYPQFNTFNSILSRGWDVYNSLQVRAEKRYSQGLFFLASYTWARGFSNGLVQNIGNFSGIKYFPLYAPGYSDRGLADTDINQNFSLSTLYELPFGKGKKHLSQLHGASQALLGGWQANALFHARTGFPLFPSVNTDQSGASVGGNRPNRTCDGTLSNPTVQAWFNTACFSSPAPGTLGNAARSVGTGPGQVNLDASIFKNFAITERVNAQFRTEFFNLTNTAQFGQPNAVIGQATTGQILSTVNTSRQIQFAIRLSF